jgi:hypothetical protein
VTSFGDDLFNMSDSPATSSREESSPNTPASDSPATTTETSNGANNNESDTQAQNHVQHRIHRENGHFRLMVHNHRGEAVPTTTFRVGDRGRGNVATIPLQRQNGSAANASSNMNVRVVRVDPLTPQPVHGSAPAATDGDSWDRFKCIICLEFMNDPVGCGNCASRFCHSCLSRFVKDASRNGKPKCPTCRVEMNSGLVPDDDLKKEICSGQTVECRFDGCSEQITLPKVADHENKCTHAMMKCRYASFGCKWKGKRGYIATHEANDCNLAKVSELVDQFRKLKADHATRLDIVHQQATGLVRMNTMIRQNMQRSQRASTSNLFALLEYCHLLTCSTAYFLFTQEKWALFFRSSEGRAAVTNFLVFLPLTVLFSTTALSGLHNLLQISKVFEQESAEERFLLADAILCISIGVLGSLMLAANFVDARSSRSWRRYRISNLMGSPPLICDILALSSFTVLVSIFEVQDAGTIKCLFLWSLMTLSTTLFPALVMVLSQQSALVGLGRNARNQIPPPTQMLSYARAFEPILFGLRYSLITHLFGVVPCLDAAVLINLLPRVPKTELFLMKNCFFEGLPNFTYVAYFGAQLAIIMGSKYGKWEDIEGFVIGSALAFVCLLFINFLTHQTFVVATHLGTKIFSQAQRAVEGRPQGPENDYILLGMASFGAWVCTLAIIAQF